MRERLKGHEQRWAEAKELQRKRLARANEAYSKGDFHKGNMLVSGDAQMWQAFLAKEEVLSKEEGWEMPPHPTDERAHIEGDDDSESEEDDDEWEEVQIVVQGPDGSAVAAQ